MFLLLVQNFAVPSKLAMVWFGEHEQGLSMAIGWTGTYVGVALGFFIPPLAVPVETADVSFPNLLRDYTVAFLAVWLLIILCFKEAPPSW